MSKIATFKHPGVVMDWENGTGADVSVGDVISLGTFCGVAQVDIANGATGPVSLSGVYEIAAVNNAAFTQGDPIYFDTVAKKATKDASNAFLGVAMRDKETDGTTGWVKIGYEWHDKAEKSITYSNTGSALEAGDVVKFSDFCGVAAEDIDATDGEGAVYIEGTFELASVTNASFAAGDRLYIDGAGKLSKLSTYGNVPIGIAADAKETAAATAFVTLSRDVAPKGEDTITYANGGAEIAAGAVVKFSDFCGIAAETIAASTGEGAVYIEGTFELASVTNASFAAGDRLYIDGAGKLSKLNTYGNMPIGIAADAKETAAATAFVTLSRDVNPRAEDTITYANGGDEIAAGAVVKFADFVGIAAETIAASTGTGRVYVTGSYTLTAVNNAAFAAGDLLYVDGDGKLTKVSTYPSIPAGICTVAKAEAGATATVRLGPGIPRLATAQA